MQSAPLVSQELIDHLRSIYPVTLNEQHSLRDYDIQVGFQKVIAYLQAVHDFQNNQ